MKKIVSIVLLILLVLLSLSACANQNQVGISAQNEIDEYFLDADEIVKKYIALLEDLDNITQGSETDALLALEELSSKSEKLVIEANGIILKNEELNNIHSLLCDTVEQFSMGVKYGYQGIGIDSKNLQELSLIELNKSSISFVDYVNAYAQFNERKK